MNTLPTLVDKIIANNYDNDDGFRRTGDDNVKIPRLFIKRW